MSYLFRFRPAFAAIVAAACLTLSAAATLRAEESEHLANMPTFALKSLAGESVDLQSFKGKPLTAVVFFATWNPKSQSVLTEFQILHDKYAENGFQVIAVNAESEKEPADFINTLIAYVTQAKVTYPVLYDEGLVVYRDWAIKAMPSIFLLGPELETRYMLAGAPTGIAETLTEDIEKSLGIAKADAAAQGPTHYQAERPVMLNFGLAQKLSQRGGGVKAQKKIEEVIQTDPKFPDAYALLGQIILTENQQKDDAAKEPAKQAFEKALELDPNLPVAMIGKAHFLLLAGDFDGAVALAKNALSKHAWGYAPKPSDEDIAKLTARLDEAAALRAGQKEAEAKAAVSDVLDGFVILRKTTRSKMHIPGQNAEKPAEAEAKSAQ